MYEHAGKHRHVVGHTLLDSREGSESNSASKPKALEKLLLNSGRSAAPRLMREAGRLLRDGTRLTGVRSSRDSFGAGARVCSLTPWASGCCCM